MKQLVSFYLGDELFGIDILLVREVNPDTNIIPVPRSRKEICGLVNIRGQVILVADLAVLLGMEARTIKPDSHVIILKTTQEFVRVFGKTDSVKAEDLSDKPIGFLVDHIGDVVSVLNKEIEPPPTHLDEGRSKLFTGIIRREHANDMDSHDSSDATSREEPLLSVIGVVELISELYRDTAMNAVTVE